MNDITSTAIQDCQAKKRELAAQVDSLRDDLKRSEKMRAKAENLAAKWEQTATQIHNERMAAVAEAQQLRSMTLWQHIGYLWRKGW